MRRITSKNPAAAAFATAIDGTRPEIDLPADLCLVLGGDGTMLHAMHEHGSGPAYLGFNFGFLGFLMNDLDPRDPLDHARRVLRERSWREHRFPRLTMHAQTTAGSASGLAVNDVCVERDSGTACHLRVSIDGIQLADRVVCDGMIVATSLGSTAYSFSAGGAAAHPLIHAIHLTTICPHAPRLAPLVLPPLSVVHIEVLDADRRPARAVVDGEATAGLRTIEVSTSPADDVRLAYFDTHDFTGTLVRKVLRM